MFSFKEQVWDLFARVDSSDCLFKVFQTVDIEGFDVSGQFKASSDINKSIISFFSFIDNEMSDISEKRLLILLNAYDRDVAEIKTTAEWADRSFSSKFHHLVIFSNNAGVPSSATTTVQHVPCNTELEFSKKVARHMEILLSNQPKGSTLKPSKAVYPKKIVNTDNLEKVDIKFDESYILNVDTHFQMFMALKSKSNKLLIFGQDAINRSKIDLPVFFRWSWAADLPYSVIILNDPTLYVNEELNGGWFVGNETEDYAQTQVDIIKKIVHWFKLDTRVTFFGASAGGFASLMLAACYGKDAQAIVDIPQIDLQTYHARTEVLKLFNAAFDINDTVVDDDMCYRVDVTKRFEKQSFVPKIKYLHNTKDSAHVLQFNYFIHRWSEIAHKLEQSQVGELTLHTYSRWHLTKGGHVPLNKQDTIEEIISFIES
ncbi:hypothetical protein CA267_012435 [Alteromonas pelagimontana]|uniref:Alpha/beta hydrolase n=1 Tax=Alteromonas pelagimontana TaxID=1858656 RepID=A0A6M4MFU5_9ALTE|nr:hypothetical protein [Alteromonas pelagimontana]QJR81530.1 hypothetical protein CA267_012435 [Alteromonas pelagimontana]